MAGPFDLQERWLATLLAGADANARFAWSDENHTLPMGYVPIQQVKGLARSLSAVPKLRPFVREDPMSGRGAYWLFPSSTDQFCGASDMGGYEPSIEFTSFLALSFRTTPTPVTVYPVCTTRCVKTCRRSFPRR